MASRLTTAIPMVLALLVTFASTQAWPAPEFVDSHEISLYFPLDNHGRQRSCPPLIRAANLSPCKENSPGLMWARHFLSCQLLDIDSRGQMGAWAYLAGHTASHGLTTHLVILNSTSSVIEFLKIAGETFNQTKNL